MAQSIFSKADSLQFHYGCFRMSFQETFGTAIQQTDKFWAAVSEASPVLF